MIDAIVAGRLTNKPIERDTRSGRKVVSTRVHIPARGHEPPLYVGISAFAPEVGAVLLALDAGDEVAVSGELRPSIYVDTNGKPRVDLEVIACRVTSLHHVHAKRLAVHAATHAEDSANG